MTYNTQNIQKTLRDKFPFLTIITYLNQQHIGIIQNCDNHFVSIYILDHTYTSQMKIDFLKCGDTWWWESNRMVPINIFLKTEWNPFRPTLKTFNSKDVEVKYGPALSLKENAQKRSKRRSITLVRRVI